MKHSSFLVKKHIMTSTIISTAWFSTFAQSPVCNCILKDVIHEKDIHQAVLGAIVYLKGMNISTFADADGKYFFKNLCPGKFILICQAVSLQKLRLK